MDNNDDDERLEIDTDSIFFGNLEDDIEDSFDDDENWEDE